MPIRIPPPELQIEFSIALAEIRRLYLVEALADTVRNLDFNETRITIKNAAGRTVFVEFAPDPDIVIREEMAPASFAEKIAIEVKAF